MNNEIKHVSPFKKFCITIGNLPTAYIESMSYYEGLTYLVNYLTNNVIPALNNNSSVVEELQEQFTILKNFVDNYFDNLDVQEEINNKLDEMVQDGTFQTIIDLLFPIKENEIGVTNTLFPYGDVRRYGAKCDGITDDKNAINTAITNAINLKFPVKLHGIMYVSETINTHGVYMVGDKQPTNSGALYPNDIGYDYPKNINDGANITFRNYIDTIVNGTAIVSDIANPILTTEYNENFKLYNFGVYGWLRNPIQEGLLVKNAPENIVYYPGGHKIENFSVFNIGLNAIHLHSLEVTTISNLIIELCNGYGLYIEGLDNKDTPFDYTKLINCRFRYTRLDAIYLYKVYRQSNEFNHCNFNYIGQYVFGHVDDIYGDRIQPTNDDEQMYAININGLNPTNAGQGRTMLFNNNYGEQLNGFLKIRNISTIAGLKMYGNSIVHAIGSTNSCYVNIDNASYLYRLSLDTTDSNVVTQYKVTNAIQIRSDDFLPSQFVSAISDITKIFNTNTKKGYKSFERLYGDNINVKDYLLPANKYSYFNSSSSSGQTIEIDIKDLVDEYFKSNWSTVHGQPFTLALLSIANGGNSTASPKCDLIAITRHNNNHLISFITNNTGATANAQGIITLTVPAYKIATLQFIQQIDTTVAQV